MTYPADDLLYFVAHQATFATHQFQGVKLIISIKEPFYCHLDNQDLPQLTAILINQNIPHALIGNESTLLIYYIDVHCPLYPVLIAYLGQYAWLDMSRQFQSLFPEWAPLLHRNSLPQLADQLLRLLFPFPGEGLTITPDERMQKLMAYIDANLAYSISLTDLARVASLSTERTRHLFGEQLGMSLSQYLIWIRLKRVIQHEVRQRSPLGETALHYGFTDQSHFSRTFKRFFGAVPYYLLKNKQINWGKVR
ncbi:helix-turn-helix domain-containing protein [Spirosoma endophyticum]|uniref:AraC-type DNA-binding protein n=1 Tax=Spirosoma endophyticum TaxID=662367 RepID=A0A1I1VM06_9BACT|nr:AraC family transcriptional regulator [Spirosoma endophyticum]SFD83941.1 AraC-type DNA-binding protein [Spirosoma endophyticum]